MVNATSITVNDLREAVQWQRILEKDSRGGTRYVEILRSHFGVISPDFRLQRPEYLGGSSTRMVINPVQKTGSTDSTSPQGNLAAYGFVNERNGFAKSFVEHCLVIGLINVRADLTYQTGINRMWSRRTREEFYWPSLANLGEQAILRKEVYAVGTANDLLAWGYQERWAEYRYFPSQITHMFRSKFVWSDLTSGTLHAWHLSQDWDNIPLLTDKDFIEENVPIERVIAVPGTELHPQPEFIFDSYMQLHCARAMPVYSIPGFMDHF